MNTIMKKMSSEAHAGTLCVGRLQDYIRLSGHFTEEKKEMILP
jgi:hypothetical protein